jgi:hypothetical protein
MDPRGILDNIVSNEDRSGETLEQSFRDAIVSRVLELYSYGSGEEDFFCTDERCDPPITNIPRCIFPNQFRDEGCKCHKKRRYFGGGQSCRREEDSHWCSKHKPCWCPKIWNISCVSCGDRDFSHLMRTVPFKDPIEGPKVKSPLGVSKEGTTDRNRCQSCYGWKYVSCPTIG